jgi:hypothetical protein
MGDFEKFYKWYITNFHPDDRYILLRELEDILIVNFDCLYDRECSIRATDQLIYLCHKLGKNKKFLFITEDGSLFEQSNAIKIISNIVECFNLTTETCGIVCREAIDIENATLIVKESIPFWCRTLENTIKDIPISPGPFSKKFAVWFHRGTFARLQIAKHLYENYKEESYISYQEKGMLADRQTNEFFQDETNWANVNTPILYDQLFQDRLFNFEMIAGSSRKPYDRYFLEIVVETDLLTTNWITEKTVKNLYIGKPFIIMGGVGVLSKIKSFGFQTFDPWINEKYDQIENMYDRLEAIKKEIDRIAELDVNQLHKDIRHILEHNRQTYGKYINSR